MGFQIYLSRDVETDEYNFQLLNFPPHHPARELQDSFYVEAPHAAKEDIVLLRTHTSPGQIHAMREYTAENPDNPPPIRIILPTKTILLGFRMIMGEIKHEPSRKIRMAH